MTTHSTLSVLSNADLHARESASAATTAVAAVAAASSGPTTTTIATTGVVPFTHGICLFLKHNQSCSIITTVEMGN